MRLIDGEKPGEGDSVRLKRTGEAGRIVHVFSVHPFKGDVVVLVGERRELCSVEEVEAATGRLRSVVRPRLFESPRVLTQPRLFALDALGDGGWLKALRLEGYALRSPRRPEGLQQALFAYHEAWG